MFKVRNIVIFLLLFSFSSCISNKILSLEEDDVYFTQQDLLSEEEMERYLESQKEDENETGN